jgi:predicted N-formylglutamate amidohydrolase
MGEAMSDGAFEPVVVENADGVGPAVIVCDHASNRIPAEYASFGFAEDALQTHIAWDLARSRSRGFCRLSSMRR